MLSPEQNELVTRTGPGAPMGEYMRRFWVPVLLATELPGPDCPPVRVSVLGEQLVAFKDTQGRVGLLDELCPHRRTSLFFGRNEENGLRCIYHGWKFDVDGNCVDMMAEPEETAFAHKVKIKTYPAREWGGHIWAYMGPKGKMPEMPQFEFGFLPESHMYMSKRLQASNWLQTLEGGLDPSHLGILHSNLNPAQNPIRGTGAEVPAAIFAGRPRFTVKQTDYGYIMGSRWEADENNYFWRISQFWLPFYSMPGPPPGKDTTLLWHAWVPADDYNAWVYSLHYNPARPLTEEELAGLFVGAHVEVGSRTWRPIRNLDNDYMIDREEQRTKTFTGVSGIGNQDLLVVEAMGTIVDRSKEHLGTTDVGVIALRRILVNAAKALQQGTEPFAAHHGDIYRIRTAATWLSKDVPFDEGVRELVEAPKAAATPG